MTLRITSAKHLILGATSILILAIVATSFATARLLRDREVEAWRHQLSSLSLLLAEQTEQTMSSAQLAMDGIVERIEAMHVSNDADLRSVAQTESMHHILRDKISGLPQVDVATIVDADGNVINFTRSFPAPPINLSERDYFQARRDDSSLGIFVSNPVRNKGNGKWVFYLSHRLNDSGGRFMGLVLVGISVDQFTDFFGRLATNLGEGASISLYRRDFSVLTRWPRQDETIGKQNLTGASHRVVEDMKKTADVIHTDIPRFSEGGRTTARLAAVRVLERFPMIVNLVVTEDFILANWRHTVSVIGAVASGSTAALLIAAMLLLRIVRQREQTETLLRELADQVPGLLFQLRQFPDGRVSVPYVNQRISEMYGLAPEQVGSSGSTIFSYCHPGDAERIRASIQASASTLQPWHEECRLALPGKGNLWCQGDAQPQKLPDGSVLWHGYVADVTERKRTEEALRDSEEHFRAVFEQAADAIFVHDLNGRFLEVNRTACESLGYSREELLGMTVMDIEQDFRPGHGAWGEVAGGRLVALKGYHKRKDGSVFPIEVKLGSLNLGGEPQIIALVRDVTLLRMAERNLRESETRLQLAIDASNVGLWDWDLRSGLAYLAPNYYEMTGYSPDQVTPDLDFFKRLIHPDDRAHVLSTMEAHLAGTSAESVFDYRMVTKSGVVKWMQGKGKVVERAADGAPLRMVGTIADITERKRAEEQLRKLSLAVEQSPEHIVITNTDAEIEYVNEAFTRTTGYSLDEVLGQNPRILHSGRTPPATYVAMWETLVQGQPWKGEFSNKRKDGSEYTEFAIIAPIREADGRITHYVAVKEDITEKKRIGDELDHYRHHLEELVEQRTVELAAARDAAQAASRAKSEFLANMSHEIRTPLNGVLGLAQIGYRDGAGRAKTRETFAKIIESGKLLLGVINDILDFSKIEAGKLQVEQVETRPGELVDHVIGLMAERALAKGLLLTAEKASDLPVACLSDPLRLQQILLNLLSNSIKFTESGRITVRASRRGECLRFEVVDTGIGMSQAQIERIFAPFEQADTSTTRRFGGTGLGLTITHRLVELLGGQITVNSTAGVGSTFAITVPCDEVERVAGRPRTELPAPAEAAGHKFAGLSILVVEDNDINQMVIEEMLVSEGATVVMAGNGLEALERVQRQGADTVDLVLMDVQMPVMDGYEATRRILEIAPGLPIVGQTAHAMAEERNKCLAAGMVDHIAKPIDPDDLVEVVLRNVAGNAVRSAPESASGHIQWDDSFSVGVKELDNHHQTLAKLINTCTDHASNRAEPDDLVETLTALVNYANFHFAYEEKLLAEHDYVELAEQVADHTEFSRVMAEACYEAIHGQADPARLLDYLTGWWRDHILKIDMKYKGVLQTRRPSSIDAS